jgi:hypothetical protein
MFPPGCACDGAQRRALSNGRPGPLTGSSVAVSGTIRGAAQEASHGHHDEYSIDGSIERKAA